MLKTEYMEINDGGMITEMIAPLYTLFCRDRLPGAVIVPQGFEELVELLYNRHGYETPSIQKYKSVIKATGATSDKIVVAFSGGLDSAYISLALRDAGHDVALHHITGLNKAFPEEDQFARKFAEVAGFSYRETVVKHTAKQKYIDNPLKNQLVLAILADCWKGEGVKRYAVGADWGTNIQQCEIGFTITDSIEVNRAFYNGMQQYLPDYELVFIPLDKKKIDRSQYIAVNHQQCLDFINSCISPHRFKAHLRKANEAKYGVQLLNGRCGSCFKCCMEWLLLNELGLCERNTAFEAHCWNVMAKSQNAHRKDLFGKAVPLATRRENLKNYGS